MIDSKTIEGRLNQGDWAEMREDDKIDFYNEDFGFKREYRVVIVSKKIILLLKRICDPKDYIKHCLLLKR